MNLIQKIADAKAHIKASKLKKEGKNTFSNYDYFTPAQTEFLVAEACAKIGLLTTFDLIRDPLGVFGRLSIYDLDTTEKLELVMATAIPEIKATNIAQQLGGCVTYTERYLKMSAFGITDNKLDFDTTENTRAESTKRANDKAVEANIAAQVKPEPAPVQWAKAEPQKPLLTAKLLAKVIERTKAGEDIWNNVLDTFEVTPDMQTTFEQAINEK